MDIRVHIQALLSQELGSFLNTIYFGIFWSIFKFGDHFEFLLWLKPRLGARDLDNPKLSFCMSHESCDQA
jgi:hypothetical protein